MRRHSNRIHAIEDEGVWLRTPAEVGNYFIRNFQDLFSTSSPNISSRILDLGGNEVSNLDNLQILRIPTLQEIKDAIWSLHPLKSPGLDGFPRTFYRTYWVTVQDQIVDFVQECFRTRGMPKGVNKTFIVLLQKSKPAKNFNHYRPTSLCNFSYKIVSKLIVNRMKTLLPRIISPNQGTFVEGQWIAENTVVAQELAHKVRKHKGKNGLMLVKLDLKKAYDCLEWGFVDKALETWGFSSEVRRLIFNCISSVEYEILVNGSSVGKVEPARGLRQGDPLSPYLFILCAEVLSRLVAKEVRIQGIKVCREAPAISHLLYADDLLISCRANNENVQALLGCLETYCSWSGQAINTEKSSVMISCNTAAPIKRFTKDTLGLKNLGDYVVYIGNKLVIGKNKSKEFNRLKERLQVRLEGWRSQLLSRARKATLIKAVAQAMPVYTMATFLVPKGVCKEMDAIIRRFWWCSKEGSRGMALKSWKAICLPKDRGGLGFRKFMDINRALLAKLGWSLARGEKNLWTDLFRQNISRMNLSLSAKLRVRTRMFGKGS